jgi:hypothetical protein
MSILTNPMPTAVTRPLTKSPLRGCTVRRGRDGWGREADSVGKDADTGTPWPAAAASSALARRLLAFFLAEAAAVRCGLPRPGGTTSGTSSCSGGFAPNALSPRGPSSEVPPVEQRGSWCTQGPGRGEQPDEAEGLQRSPLRTRASGGGQLRALQPDFRGLGQRRGTQQRKVFLTQTCQGGGAGRKAGMGGAGIRALSPPGGRDPGA